jgi:hypothetical protein
LGPLPRDPDIPASPNLDSSGDSSINSDSDEEGVPEEQEGEGMLFPAMPGTHPNPHIARLIDSLQCPYYHSTSEKDMGEMQNLQDYLNGCESLALLAEEWWYS